MKICNFLLISNIKFNLKCNTENILKYFKNLKDKDKKDIKLYKTKFEIIGEILDKYNEIRLKSKDNFFFKLDDKFTKNSINCELIFQDKNIYFQKTDINFNYDLIIHLIKDTNFYIHFNEIDKLDENQIINIIIKCCEYHNLKQIKIFQDNNIKLKNLILFSTLYNFLDGIKYSWDNKNHLLNFEDSFDLINIKKLNFNENDIKYIINYNIKIEHLKQLSEYFCSDEIFKFISDLEINYIYTNIHFFILIFYRFKIFKYMNTKIFYKFTNYILNTDITNSKSINIDDRLITNYEKSLFYYNTFKNYYTDIEKIRNDYIFPFDDFKEKTINKNLLIKIFENLDTDIILKLKNYNYDFESNNYIYDYILSYYSKNKNYFLKFILDNDICWTGKLLEDNLNINLRNIDNYYEDYVNTFIEQDYTNDINNYKNFLETYLNKFKNMEEDSKKIIILDLIKNCFTELIDEYFEILLDGQSLCYYINLNISIFDENLLESYNLRFDSQNYYEELILYLNMQYN